jgi:hypothetical protein
VLASVWYNFSGGAAVTGHKEDALLYLGKAIDLGLTGPDWIAADSDLESLHPDPALQGFGRKSPRSIQASLTTSSPKSNLSQNPVDNKTRPPSPDKYFARHGMEAERPLALP